MNVVDMEIVECLIDKLDPSRTKAECWNDGKNENLLNLLSGIKNVKNCII